MASPGVSIFKRVGLQSGLSDGDRDFLQRRIAVFGKVGCLLSLCFYVVVNVLGQLGRPQPMAHWADISNLAILAVAAILGVLWLACRGGSRSLSALRLMDIGGTMAACAGCAVHGWLGGDFEGLKFNALLATTNILIFRAILLPSSVRTTALVGLLAQLPSLAPAYLLWLRPVAGIDPHVLQLEMAFFTGWCFVALAVSTVVSHVVYGLRRRAREALSLGQYRLEERIGAGGMGVVYRAGHAMLRRPTAIKLLRPERAGAEAIARFEQEVQQTSRLTHPNTVAIYDFGRTPGGLFYYAMEYLPGLDLQALVTTHGPQPPAMVIHVLGQICGSLAEAHGVGLVHRDIKPSNIILCERGGVRDVVKVVDFGLVKDVADDDEGDGAAEILGTPFCLAPEAIRGPDRVDARTDLYSVGVVGYFLLTGGYPFEDEGVRQVLLQHLHQVPPRPSLRAPGGVPEDLEALILSCLEKQPKHRPGSAGELRKALDACADAGSWDPCQSPWWQPGHQVVIPPSGDISTDLLPGTEETQILTVEWRCRGPESPSE